jgi:hypothetical protein
MHQCRKVVLVVMNASLAQKNASRRLPRDAFAMQCWMIYPTQEMKKKTVTMPRTRKACL